MNYVELILSFLKDVLEFMATLFVMSVIIVGGIVGAAMIPFLLYAIFFI
jgi:hypothetical protein